MYLSTSNGMSDYVVNPNTMFATKVPILDKSDGRWTWFVYIKGLALRRKVWKYIYPEDETITNEEPVEPTRPVPTKAFKDMNEGEQFAWEMESEGYYRLKRIYYEELDGLTTVWTAMWNTVSENHRFAFRRNPSDRTMGGLVIFYFPTFYRRWL
ncbi:hypothetical protein Aspvir_001603 [Aspergillus viridinutans]|uniref:Uncharacterized protein n=1 Tax=Aspergillus viridinutans TaxID=75553 RepID=A0A9P3EZI7_ASPVI|nr:uncharacterized protein Aspvir_001603 [Aspergillus viridinutans]GIJ99471.1 hypothetical protein Aspvir_001603 [Aspergillus viridinutans]